MSKAFHLPEEGAPIPDGFHWAEEHGLILPNDVCIPPPNYVPPFPSVPYAQGNFPTVNVFFAKEDAEAKTPTRGTEGSYGSDLYACLGYDHVLDIPGNKIIKKGWVREIPIGIRIAVPWGCGFKFEARSSQEIKHRFRLLGGVIDWDFGGRISVFLANEGDSDYTVHHHDRVAQVIAFPVFLQNWIECPMEALPTYSSRGENGIGSTGK